MDFTDKINAFNEERQRKAEQQGQTDQIVGAVQTGNEDLSKSMRDLLMATMLSKDPEMIQVAQQLSSLLEQISSASEQFGNSSLQLLPMANTQLAAAVKQLTTRIEQSPDDLAPYFQDLYQEIAKISDYRPVINVPEQPVEVDLKPLLEALKEVKREIKANKVDIPENDVSEIVNALKGVQKQIRDQRFPVPNYILPFKDANGKAVQVQLDGSGNLPIAGGGSGVQSDLILESTSVPGQDGIVVLNPDGTNVGGGGGGGSVTEYTQDAAAPTNPTAPSLSTRRTDSLAAVGSDGDWVTARSTNKGELYVKHVDSVPVTGTFYQATQPVSGTVTANAGTGPWPVTDNSGSLTVDAPVGTPVFVRLSDGTSAISTLPVSLASVPSHAVTNAGTFAVQAAQSGTWNIGTVSTITNVVHVDDNGGSLTVDGAVTASPVTSSTATLSNVSSATSSTTLLASNANRRTAIFYNDSTSDCYIKYGSSASSTSFTLYCPSFSTISFEGKEYTGIVTGIWISANGSMRVTETTA